MDRRHIEMNIGSPAILTKEKCIEVLGAGLSGTYYFLLGEGKYLKVHDYTIDIVEEDDVPKKDILITSYPTNAVLSILCYFPYLIDRVGKVIVQYNSHEVILSYGNSSIKVEVHKGCIVLNDYHVFTANEMVKILKTVDSPDKVIDLLLILTNY